MKANQKMARLLQGFDLNRIFNEASSVGDATKPPLTIVDDCVLLSDEVVRSGSVSVGDFPDRTGFECFVNHVHLPYDGTSQSLRRCLSYAANLRTALKNFAPGRQFLLIISVSDDNCVVRFHQLRPSENWLTDNLDDYLQEAILTIHIDGGWTTLLHRPARSL